MHSRADRAFLAAVEHENGTGGVVDEQEIYPAFIDSDDDSAEHCIVVATDGVILEGAPEKEPEPDWPAEVTRL
ncbi:hypothetical protein PG996_010961 [Apiospora saccharicola]|uniref:Uncharacterized protein n=1 Tax=Apiospora saccharicola TaxID=335842 RepID=A0ABR1UDR1_9PEZI